MRKNETTKFKGRYTQKGSSSRPSEEFNYTNEKCFTFFWFHYSGGVRGVQVVQLHHLILRKLHCSKAIAPLDLKTLK